MVSLTRWAGTTILSAENFPRFQDLFLGFSTLGWLPSPERAGKSKLVVSVESLCDASVHASTAAEGFSASPPALGIGHDYVSLAGA
jgi:hypothetical protein